MSFRSFEDPKVLDVNELQVKNLKVESANIHGEITKKNSLSKVGFPLLVLGFIIGALTFAIALTYNDFAQTLIKKYSFGTGITARFINLILITGVTIILIYIAWRVQPEVVSNVVG